MFTETQKFTVKFKEYDLVNNRDGNVIRTLVREAASMREAENKIRIQFNRCRIVSVKIEE